VDAVVLAQAWRWDFAAEVLPILLRGLRVTVQATVLGTALAMVLGLFLTLGLRSRRWYVTKPLRVLLEFIRSTPLLVQLYFVFFVAPLVIGLRLPPVTTGVLVLGIHYACYIAEVYRAGIESVPRGQWEAATALNLSRTRMWRRVVLPQAIPPVVPALGNYLISMFKDTPQLLAIGVPEMLNEAQAIGSRRFRYQEPITIVGALFIVLSYLSALLTRALERRYGRAEGTAM
jgi:polar amino acid transport system permease protein